MLAYERSGSGEPLVLIHGIGHRRQAWYPVRDLLAEHFDVVLVDLPGHGETREALEAGTTPRDALRVLFGELFAELGIDRPHVAGNSLGGLIALELGGAGMARSVTALSPAGFWRGRVDLLYVRGLFAAVLLAARLARPVAHPLLATRAGRAAMLGWLHAHPSRVETELARGDYANLLRARGVVADLFAAAYLFEADAAAATVPTTVAWSGRDLVLLPYQARRARALLPHARHLRLPGVGHVPMPDDPALVARTLLEGAQGSAQASAAGSAQASDQASDQDGARRRSA